jgi:hypothetical protein
MFNFQYEIKIGVDGRPYISPVKETEKEMSFIEHKFMGIELCRTIISQTVLSHQENPQRRPLPPGEVERLLYLEDELIRFSDIFAKSIKEQFELLDIADRLINKTYDVSVDTIEERDQLNYNGFIFDDKIFKREIGLKVKVLRTGDVYVLKDGVDNEHWNLLN